MESLCASEKKELVHQASSSTRAKAKTAIFENIEGFDNRQRQQSAIGYQTPTQAFETMSWHSAA